MMWLAPTLPPCKDPVYGLLQTSPKEVDELVHTVIGINAFLLGGDHVYCQYILEKLGLHHNQERAILSISLLKST